MKSEQVVVPAANRLWHL